MLVYGMESAALTQADLHRLESFHSKALRKMHRIPATFYTKVLDSSQPTTSNQQLRQQASQPPLTHYIHRAQLKLFGHILRAPAKCLERDCCFTSAFHYRRGRGRTSPQNTLGGAMCSIVVALASGSPEPSQLTKNPAISVCMASTSHRLAVRRQFWSRLVGLPTCRKYLKPTFYISYSQ